MRDDVLTLYGCRGCGSAAIEALLALLDVPVTCITWDWHDQSAWARYADINPQRQVPMLVLEDGAPMTESAAIICWLLQQDSAAPLLPLEDAARAQMVRWLIYLASQVYPAIGIWDFPERWLSNADAAQREALRQGALARIEAAWLHLEAELPAPHYLLGERLTALDLYCAMMLHWQPGTAWFAAHCPKLTAAARHTEAHPRVAAIFAQHFQAGA